MNDYYFHFMSSTLDLMMHKVGHRKNNFNKGGFEL